MSASIEVTNVKKTFFTGLRRKRTDAVKDISFTVEEGEIFGFLGPNGAGKTTTIKAMIGLIRPTGGNIKLLGIPHENPEWRGRVGYMPEHPNFYDFLTGLELVTWFGRLSGLAGDEAERQAKVNLERVGLAHAMHMRTRKYSKGMLQRSGLAAALMGSPELLILDEPMTGLDPIGRKDIRELILELRDEGRTIFYSTHILPDVEMTCDRVSIIHKGVTQRTGTLREILGETTRGVSVVLTGLNEELTGRLKETHENAIQRAEEIEVFFDTPEPAREFMAEMMQAGATVVAFRPHEDNLESIFMRSLDDRGAA